MPTGERERERGGGGERERERERERQTDRQTDRQTETERDRQTDRNPGRQADRQAGRQADRQTDKQTEQMFVSRLPNVPATCKCISGTDLLRQFTCYHNEVEVADQTFHLTQSQYTDTQPTSPSADPIMPGAWLGSHWSANY